MQTLTEIMQVHALKEFFRWAITEGPFDGCDLDGGAVQNKAEALGLIVKVPFDPAKHYDDTLELEPGQDFFVFADGISEAEGQASPTGEAAPTPPEPPKE